jgi:SAM-dependent methyltransferase
VSHFRAEPIQLRPSRRGPKPLSTRWVTIKGWIKAVIFYNRAGYAEQRRARRLLSGKHAPPAVLQSKERIYVAYRPDSDVGECVYPEIRQLSESWTKGNEENNSGDLPRLYALILNIRQILEENIPGELAELGVYRGNSAAVLAHYARASGKHLFLFDTFEGFDRRDLISNDEERPIEFGQTSLDLVKFVVGEDSVTFVQGWFPQSIPSSVKHLQFCVVHFDCDLYEPAKAALEFFYPRLSPGGLLIFHDYANPSWDGIKRAVDEFFPQVAERPVILGDKSGTAMIRKSVGHEAR